MVFLSLVADGAEEARCLWDTLNLPEAIAMNKYPCSTVGSFGITANIVLLLGGSDAAVHNAMAVKSCVDSLTLGSKIFF